MLGMVKVEGLTSYESIVLSHLRRTNKKQRQRLHWILNQINTDAPLVITDEGRIVYANEKGCSIMGYALGDIIGRSVLEFIGEPSGEKAVAKSIGNGRETVYIHEYQHPTYGLVNIKAEPRMFDYESGTIRITSISIVE